MGALMEEFKSGATGGASDSQLMSDFMTTIATRDIAINAEGHPIEPPSVWARLGRGAADVTQGIKQLYLMAVDSNKAKEYTKEVDREIGLYEKGRVEGARRNAAEDKSSYSIGTPYVADVPGKEGMTHYPQAPDMGLDWGRIAGSTGMSYPFARAIPGFKSPSLAVRTGSSALQGGTVGGLLYTPEEGSKIGQVTTGAIAGGSVPLVTNTAASVAGRVRGGLDRVPGRVFNNLNLKDKVRVALQRNGIDVNKLESRVIKNLMDDARRQVNATGNLDAAALARKLRAESLGFVDDAAPTTGQVTRSPKQWARERNMQKLEDIGDDITGRFQSQDRQFLKLQENIKTKGTATSDYEAGQSIHAAVSKKWADTQKEVSRLYNGIREKYGDISGIDGWKLSGAIDNLSDDISIEHIPKSVSNRLEKLGLIKDGKATGKTLTVKQAEELRKWIGGLGGKTPSENRARKILIEALDDDVFEMVGDDFFKKARDAASARFKDFETKVLDNIVQKGKEGDDLFKQIMRSDVKDIAGLKTNLLSFGNEAGEQAWENIRKRTIHRMWYRATQGKMDEGQFSGAAFKKEMEAIGKQRLNQIFTKEEVELLNKIEQVGIDLTYTPPYSAVNWSNTTPALFNLMRRSKALPVIGDALSEAANKGANKVEVARALSSSPVDLNTARSLDLATKQAINRWTGQYGRWLPAVAGSQGQGLLGWLPEFLQE